MSTGKSFSLYVFHGGTNFGFTAGANGNSPSITSYDYGAPLNEQGVPTKSYYTYRKLLAFYRSEGNPLPDVPATIPTMEIPDIKLERWSSLWAQLPTPVTAEKPEFFEQLGQNQGFVVYRTRIPAGEKGSLKMTLHGYPQVYLDGVLMNGLDLPARDKECTLEILVEAMGHINFQGEMETDRKGILGDVELNGSVLKNWEMQCLPLKSDWMMSLSKTAPIAGRIGGIFKGEFNLNTVADTYLDMSNYKKGVLWVNGHNLGRYWSTLGPQKRLYCPAPWLKMGTNTIVVLDVELTQPQPIDGCKLAVDPPDPYAGLKIKSSQETPFDIHVPEGAVCTRDIPWPDGSSVAVARVDSMQDAAMSWGVGTAIGWNDGKYVQCNVRSDGSWNIRQNGKETFGGDCPVGTPGIVAIKLTDQFVQIFVKDDDDDWRMAKEFPRGEFPGTPATIRIGKIGATWIPQNYSLSGAPTSCRVDWVRVYGPK
jgi:hypothetical protein